MSRLTARLLRAVSEQLTEKIVPDLSSAHAIEGATLASQVLQLLASDIDALAQASGASAPGMRAKLTDAIESLPKGSLEQERENWRDQLRDIATETDLGCQREIRALRDLSSRVLRTCADQVDEGKENAQGAMGEIAAALGRQDMEWLEVLEAAKQVQAEPDPDNRQDLEATGPGSGNVDLNPQLVTGYLRQRYPDSPDICATSVVSVPGGRSKKTWFISIDDSDELPREFVMRQDYQLHYEGTKVRDEYEPLAKFSQLRLPVPAPLLIETGESMLGQPFLFMEKLPGTPPGSYFGLRENCPGAFADLAHALAQIHRTDPVEAGFPSVDAPGQNLLRLIERFQEKWRANTLNPSPVIDYALSWARRVCHMDPGQVAVVHGDIGPHNMLVEDDRLTALLDWEFSHLGDPAEDLGIARVYAEDVMQWSEFMGIYMEAGGQPVPERRIELAMVLHFLKGASLVAVSGRNFEEGWTGEFVKGATSFAGLRQIELTLIPLLRRFDPAQPV